jgi:hypothetical protein
VRQPEKADHETMNQQLPSAMAGVLCAWLITIPIVLLVGGLILRVACWISGAAVPPFVYAAFVALLTWFVMALVTFLARLVLGVAAVQWRLTEPQLRLTAVLFGFPVHLLVAAALYSGLLQVSFGKGIIIRLAEVLIALVAGVIITVLYLFVRGGLAGLGI